MRILGIVLVLAGAGAGFLLYLDGSFASLSLPAKAPYFIPSAYLCFLGIGCLRRQCGAYEAVKLTFNTFITILAGLVGTFTLFVVLRNNLRCSTDITALDISLFAIMASTIAAVIAAAVLNYRSRLRQAAESGGTATRPILYRTIWVTSVSFFLYFDSMVAGNVAAFVENDWQIPKSEPRGQLAKAEAPFSVALNPEVSTAASVAATCSHAIASNFHAVSEWLKHPNFHLFPSPPVDVWKLRDDVAALESLQTTDDSDHCYTEGGEEEADPNQSPPSPQELEQQKKAVQQQAEAAKACVADVAQKYKAYMMALEAFNRTWMPALTNAIESGDPVAEVIMRQCSTTSVLDRTNIESTCDPNPERRAVAAKRLKEIGFAPAFDWEFEAMERKATDPEELKVKRLLAGKYMSLENYHAHQLMAGQDFLLEQFAQGAFGAYGSKSYDVNDHGTIYISKYDLIASFIQSAPRAFTFTPGLNEWATTSFGTLQLVRRPLTPGILTWGPTLFSHYDDKPTINGDGYVETWRRAPKELPKAGSFRKPLELGQFIVTAEANIDRYLKQDSRWGVFLLHRVGHHEWIPEGTRSDTHKLTPDWVGEWELEKTFEDWREIHSIDPSNDQDLPRSASITNEGEYTRIVFKTNSTQGAPLKDASCMLRYSGGSTYVSPAATENEQPPKQDTVNQDWSHTMFGDLKKDCSHYLFISGAGTDSIGGGQCKTTNSNGPAFAPLDSNKSYKQVLVQCDEGESIYSNRVRFLLLEGDALVEFAANAPYKQTFYVRHYRRRGSNKTVN